MSREKIMENEIVIIQTNQSEINFPSNTVGIDIGSSLTKVAYLEQENELNLLLLPTESNFKKIVAFIVENLNRFKKFNFTGGRGFSLYKKYSKEFESNLFSEFQANSKGLEAIHLINKKKALPNSLIITIGTGTSIILKTESFKHLGGTALGGGLFMGLLKLLFNMNNFREAIKLASKGNRNNVDLKVSDIYDPEDDRVDSIFREFNAASFGKIVDDFDINSAQKADVLNSLINIIGENIGIIAYQMAKNNDIDNIVFCGGFLKDNKVLKRILSLLCRVNNIKATFLKNSEFCGAIGALLI